MDGTGKDLRGGKAVPRGEPRAQLDEEGAGIEKAGKCTENQTGVLSMKRKARGNERVGTMPCEPDLEHRPDRAKG